MTEAEIKNILGPRPTHSAFSSFIFPIILVALIALLFFIGGDALFWVFFLVIALALAVPCSLGLFIAHLTHLSTYKYLHQRLTNGEFTPGYALNPLQCNGYILIDKDKNLLVLGKEDRNLKELNTVEYHTGNKKNEIEFIFRSGDDPIVKYKIHSSENTKKEFMKISNYLGLSTT